MYLLALIDAGVSCLRWSGMKKNPPQTMPSHPLRRVHIKPAVPLKLRLSAPLFRLHQALCLYAAFTGSAYLPRNGYRELWDFRLGRDGLASIARSASQQMAGSLDAGWSQPSSSSPLIKYSIEDILSPVEPGCQMMILLNLLAPTGSARANICRNILFEKWGPI